jgi:4-methyl-5(b-hydroxyethyl)-thiazole monophosphate biosynthesis
MIFRLLIFILENKIIFMRLVIFLADGFEDIEAFTVIDLLRRASVNIDTVGVPGFQITSKSGIKVFVDKRLAEVKEEDYDGIVLPGGSKNVDILGRTTKVIEFLKKMYAQNKLIAAICAAPSILAKHGLLDNKKATIFPGMEKELPYPRGARVVVDGNIITSQAAGTSMDFALILVEKLVGKAKAMELRKNIVV